MTSRVWSAKPVNNRLMPSLIGHFREFLSQKTATGRGSNLSAYFPVTIAYIIFCHFHPHIITKKNDTPWTVYIFNMPFLPRVLKSMSIGNIGTLPAERVNKKYKPQKPQVLVKWGNTILPCIKSALYRMLVEYEAWNTLQRDQHQHWRTGLAVLLVRPCDSTRGTWGPAGVNNLGVQDLT